MPIAQKAELIFSSFWCYFFESHGWLFYSRVRLVSRSLWFNFWLSFLFRHFSWVGRILLCWFESFLLLLPFLQLLVLVPRGTVPFALWEVTLGFLPFSCWISDTWEGRICSLFLVFLWCFPLSCFNPVLAVLYASENSSLWQSLGIPIQLFYVGSSSIFWFGSLFFFFFLFLHRLWGSYFMVFFGLQAFWAYHLSSF